MYLEKSTVLRYSRCGAEEVCHIYIVVTTKSNNGGGGT